VRQRTTARYWMLQKVLAETPVRVAANIGNKGVVTRMLEKPSLRQTSYEASLRS